MRSLIAVLACLSAAPAAAENRLFLAAGVGLPELAHLEVGYFVLDQLSVEVRGGTPVFNPMVGVGATYALGAAREGRPPRHAALFAAQAMLNPTLGQLTFESAGERLAATLGLYAGYGFISDAGFFLRVLGGGFFYWGAGLAVGPNATVAIGWAF